MDQFELAYRLGYVSGDQVGYGRCMHELYQGSLIHRFRLGPLDIPLTELIERRAEIGEACKAFTDRHGKPYQGGPVNWYTGRSR